jgi:UDP-N-acetylmuramate--alanine ligase
MGYIRALCVFQSHTYSRTFYLYDKFAAAFKDVSRLLIYPIFPAREENVFELSEEDFARDCGGEYIPDLEMLAQKIKTSDCDVVIIMGAGDLCDKLKKYLL